MARFAHVLGAALWVGGRLTVSLVVLPLTRCLLDEERRGRMLSAVGRRFGLLTVAAFLPVTWPRDRALKGQAVNGTSVLTGRASRSRSDHRGGQGAVLASAVNRFFAERMHMSEPRLFVPVRVGAFAVALRLFRTASGERTAVAFSSPLKLARALGAEQRWVELTAPALRAMIADLDAIGIVVDPAGTMAGPAEQVA